jgi:hypothetical protein
MLDYPLETILLPMGAKEIKDEVKMDALWEDDDYIAEVKYDGSRYVSVGGRMFSRRVSDVTHFPVEKTGNVPHIVDILNKYPLLILDGETYYEGMNSNDVTSIMGASSDKARWRQGFGEFEAPFLVGSKGRWRMDESQEWVEVAKKEVAELAIAEIRAPLKYVMFDILRDFDGTWLTDLPHWSRRSKLLKAYAKICMDLGVAALPNIELSRIEPQDKLGFYNKIIAEGGEGVILKNINGLYFTGAKPMWNWIKVKKHITVDVVIMGFKPATKEYEPLRDGLLATHPYWELQRFDYDNDMEQVLVGEPFKYNGILSNPAPQIKYTPVTKFYFHDWIGAVTFGQLDPSNTVTMCERNGENCQEYPQLKELGYFSGINEELRKDMSENPLKYIGECVEIGAMEQTKDGFYRHPQFSRLRPDKNSNECIIGG